MMFIEFYKGLTVFYKRPYKLESDGLWRTPDGKVIDKPEPYFNAIRSYVKGAMAERKRVYSYSTFSGQYIPQVDARVIVSHKQDAMPKSA
jgi:hypothetical protein